jgi:transcriptional regulator with XRE-family HTH domain
MAIDKLNRNVIDQKIGANVKKKRDEFGFDIVYMARILGTSPSEYRKLEGGLRRFGAGHLLKIASLFEMSPASFFDKIMSGKNVTLSTGEQEIN